MSKKIQFNRLVEVYPENLITKWVVISLPDRYPATLPEWSFKMVLQATLA